MVWMDHILFVTHLPVELGLPPLLAVVNTRVCRHLSESLPVGS